MTNRDVDKTVRGVRRATRRKFSAQGKVCPILVGWRLPPQPPLPAWGTLHLVWTRRAHHSVDCQFHGLVFGQGRSR